MTFNALQSESYNEMVNRCSYLSAFDPLINCNSMNSISVTFSAAVTQCTVFCCFHSSSVPLKTPLKIAKCQKLEKSGVQFCA